MGTKRVARRRTKPREKESEEADQQPVSRPEEAEPNNPPNSPPTAPPVRKRARIGKGKDILPPSESDLKGHLNFTKKTEKERYQGIYRRSIIPCRKDSAGVLSKAEFYFLWCMQNDIKVNLGCWLASQFASVLTNRRPLILGSLITQLAVHEDLIDLENNDLHVACEMLPLDLDCLAGMGLIGKKKDVFYFYPPGPIMTRQQRKILDANNDDVVQNSGTAPSTSATPSQGRYDHRFERLELQIGRMERNLTAFFHHIGFTPPSPPSIFYGVD